jgi:multidrug efflux pump
MRNSVILVDQVRQDEAAGLPLADAIVNSTVRRFRPIMLTAAAAVLAMIPLSTSAFWGPMAIAMMGGLFVATILTVTFLPSLYAWSFGASKAGAASPAEVAIASPAVADQHPPALLKAGE